MRLRITGIVQGVGFRPAVYRAASSLGLSGRVWNEGSGVVVDINDSERFIEALMKSLPPLARIDSLEFEDVPFDRGTVGFSITGSGEGAGGFGIPADTAICDACIDDMRKGRRKDYEFTSCTDCGARFTLLAGTPYDRGNTSMGRFNICGSCEKEYNDPGNRRFHHQTVCCPECGPRYRLLDKDGNEIRGDAVLNFARMLDAGSIGIAKSWGGMHICASPKMVDKLREWYGRNQKPFAVMAKDMDSVRAFANPDEQDTEQLLSLQRPIVLVRKVPSDITERISPGLDNIGMFLPYTGMQHRLLLNVDSHALIMTSANLPGEPMILDDTDIMELGADAYLIHDQMIVNRADDSVLRINCGNVNFIRRSRGHVPSYIGFAGKGCALALGAHENLTASVALDGRIHSTQHIGDGDSLGVPEYLENASRSLMDMLGRSPDIIAVDMHPGYSNRPVAKRLAEEFGCGIVEVQHHWAHAASLLADNGEEECVCISIDGTGYGTDGNAWGGEILRSDLHSFDRLAHLQYIPLLGSEKALYDLRRLKFAIDDINKTESHIFSERDAEVLRKMTSMSVKTSSFGRLLDALAYTLGVCDTRTYDGEPAMKMEPLLAKGKLIRGFETTVKDGQIMTAELFSRIEEKQDRNDVAYSIIRSIIGTMTEIACDAAASFGMKSIGLTGGVSYNGPICRMAKEEIESRGFRMLAHGKVPNGDGGISVGQAAVASRRVP